MDKHRRTTTASAHAGRGATAASLGSRLQALPKELLHRILRTAGRPTRRICRAFRAAYSPLNGGFCLEHFSTRWELAALATTSGPGAFRHIHTLVLDPPYTSRPPPPILLAPVPSTFPTLRSLRLCDPITLTAPLVRMLAPLAPTLTSLTASIHKPIPALATTLTSLRALVLTCHLSTCPDGPRAALTSLHPLAPTLARLSFHIQSVSSLSSTQSLIILPHLTALSRLTHLFTMSTRVEPWTPAATHLLATALPHLRSLSCGWRFWLAALSASAPDPQGVLSALATRTALTSLTLPLMTHSYSRLAPLRLHHLHIPVVFPGHQAALAELITTVGQAATLTCLEVRNSESCSGLSGAWPALAPSLKSLTLTPGSSIQEEALLPLSQLTHLETLGLRFWWTANNIAGGLTDGQAATIAGALTRLTSLSVAESRHMADAAGSMATQPHPLVPLLRQVAARGTLRHLALVYWEPCWGEVLLAPLAACLVRLSLEVARAEVWQALQRLGHLRALRSLQLNVLGCRRAWAPLAAAASGTEATAGQDQAEAAGGSGTSSSSNMATSGSTAGGQGFRQRSARLPLQPAVGGRQVPATQAVQGPAGASPGAGGGHGGAGGGAGGASRRMRLPPGLRQLWVNTLIAGADGLDFLAAEQRAALLAAAARQDCVVRVDRVRRPEYDDCCGYRDGAAAEFVDACSV